MSRENYFVFTHTEEEKVKEFMGIFATRKTLKIDFINVLWKLSSPEVVFSDFGDYFCVLITFSQLIDWTESVKLTENMFFFHFEGYRACFYKILEELSQIADLTDANKKDFISMVLKKSSYRNSASIKIAKKYISTLSMTDAARSEYFEKFSQLENNDMQSCSEEKSNQQVEAQVNESDFSKSAPRRTKRVLNFSECFEEEQDFSSNGFKNK